MAFIDKFNEATEMLTEKSAKLVVFGKLSSAIVTDRADISKLRNRMADYCYKQYKAGIPIDQELVDLCRQIDTKLDDIAKKQKYISLYKSVFNGKSANDTDYNDVPDYSDKK